MLNSWTHSECECPRVSYAISAGPFCHSLLLGQTENGWEILIMLDITVEVHHFTASFVRPSVPTGNLPCWLLEIGKLRQTKPLWRDTEERRRSGFLNRRWTVLTNKNGCNYTCRLNTCLKAMSYKLKFEWAFNRIFSELVSDLEYFVCKENVSFWKYRAKLNSARGDPLPLAGHLKLE